VAVSNFKDILKWGASPKNEIASQRPFELPQNHKITVLRYSHTFARMICYVIRTAPESINTEIENKETENKETKTGVKFSKLQLVYVKNIREAAAVAVADDNNELDTHLWD
jgi:hypothetical protein